MLSKSIVVTGGTKGIGLDITRSFCDAGFSVFVGARTYPNTDLFPSNAKVIITDVRVEASVANLVEAALHETGSLHAIVNNAGYSEWRPIEKIDHQFLMDIMSTNLFGAFWGCKAAAAVMKPGASIINVSSIAGKRGSSNNAAYVATKFAMNGLTQSLCKELGPRGIRVNGVCPVLIPTSGLLEALNSPDSPTAGTDAQGFIDRFAQVNSALGRLPTGSEVGAACVFLTSEDASGITGQNINIDCGVYPQ